MAGIIAIIAIIADIRITTPMLLRMILLWLLLGARIPMICIIVIPG